MDNKNKIKKDNEIKEKYEEIKELKEQIEKLEVKIDNLEQQVEGLKELNEELENGGMNLLIDTMKYECFVENHHKFTIDEFQKLME